MNHPSNGIDAGATPIDEGGLSGGHSHLELRPWPRPQGGHDPRSAYVERFWLGVLGPSAVWFLRLARRELDATTATRPAILELEDTARQLGLGHRGGRHSPLMRTVDRCVRFGMARAGSRGCLEVSTLLPPVPQTLRSRLPDHLRLELRAWDDTGATRNAAEADTAELEILAGALIELGAGLHESAERLTSWGVDVDRARHVTARAWSSRSGHPSLTPAPLRLVTRS